MIAKRAGRAVRDCSRLRWPPQGGDDRGLPRKNYESLLSSALWHRDRISQQLCGQPFHRQRRRITARLFGALRPEPLLDQGELAGGSVAIGPVDLRVAGGKGKYADRTQRIALRSNQSPPMHQRPNRHADGAVRQRSRSACARCSRASSNRRESGQRAGNYLPDRCFQPRFPSFALQCLGGFGVRQRLFVFAQIGVRQGQIAQDKNLRRESCVLIGPRQCFGQRDDRLPRLLKRAIEIAEVVQCCQDADSVVAGAMHGQRRFVHPERCLIVALRLGNEGGIAKKYRFAFRIAIGTGLFDGLCKVAFRLGEVAQLPMGETEVVQVALDALAY